MHVLSSMGFRPSLDAVAAQLASIANGELTLMPTPEEAIREIEKETGKTLPDNLKASVREMMGNRASNDEANQRIAVQLLQTWGYLSNSDE